MQKPTDYEAVRSFRPRKKFKSVIHTAYQEPARSCRKLARLTARVASVSNEGHVAQTCTQQSAGAFQHLGLKRTPSQSEPALCLCLLPHEHVCVRVSIVRKKLLNMAQRQNGKPEGLGRMGIRFVSSSGLLARECRTRQRADDSAC